MNHAVRILVVDDDPDTLNGSARLLEKAGYTVERASSGEAALQAVRNQRPDLLLLDYHLPDIDGLDVCRRVKRDPGMTDSLVVIVSASHAESDQQAAGLEAGADGYIGRPIANRELLARVNSFVRILLLIRAQSLHAGELKQSNEAVRQAQLASLNLMEDAVVARDRAEQAGQALKDSEHRYHSLFDQANTGIFIMTPAGQLVEVNRTFAEMHGYTLDELKNMDIRNLDVLKTSTLDKRAEIIRRIEAGDVVHFEVEHFHKDGHPFPLSVSVSSIHLGGQTFYLAFHQDISERKQAESYREMGREVLQILNEPGDLQDAITRIMAAVKTRTGFDAVGIRLQAGDDFPYFAQQGFSTEFLLTENTLIERDKDGGVCRDKDGNISLECTCGLVISSKTDPANPFFTAGGSFWTNDALPLLDLPPGEDPRLHPRNQCIHHGYASVALVPIRDKNRIVGLLHFNDRRKGCFTLDAIESIEGIAAHIGAALMRKQAEAEKAKLENQNRQLQKDESLGRMAGAIAHHFNNQLMAVMGGLELAMQDLPRGTQPYATLIDAMQSAQRAAEVSRLMLTYLGQTPAAHVVLDLAETCRQNLPVVCAGMPKNVALETDLPAPGPAISANTNQIHQILTNLLVNACEAIGAAEGVIHLTVTTVATADIPTAHHFPIGWQPHAQTYACLAVADTGGGIADPDIEKLFEPFFSTKFTGRGLGLPVVLGIVRAHEGLITVASQMGHGSIFRVFLPLAQASAAAAMPATAGAGMAAGPTPAGTVLVVEDDAAVRKVAAGMLARLGFTVLAAPDGVEALKVFQQRQAEICCVLCDLSMPRMDGWATLTALRQIAPGLPVILASGYDEAQVMAGEHPERPQVFLGKPYQMQALRAALGKAMAGN